MSFSLPHPNSVSSPVVIDTFGAIQVISSRADVKTDLFLNPPSTGSNGPDNSVWVLGTTQRVRWSTMIQIFNFFLYQQLVCDNNNCVNGPFLIAQNLTNETNTWDWQVTTGTLTLTPTNTFFLVMRDVNDDQNQFNSSCLNFTSSDPLFGGSSKQASTSTKSSAVTQSSSSTVAVTSSSSVRASPSSSNAPSTIVSPIIPATTLSGPIFTSTSTSTIAPTAVPITSPNSMSTGAKVGMLIGAISAVVIAIFIGWYLGRRRKIRTKKSPFHPFETPPPAPPVQLAELHVPGWGEQKPIPPPFTPRELHGNGKFDSFKGVRELDAWEKPGELDAGRRSGAKSGVYELGPRYT